MHPTVDEQLEGIARLIERSVARHPAGPDADRLRSAAGTLRRIAGAWASVLPFLTWDNEATFALLQTLGVQLPKSIATRAAALAAAEIDPLSVRAVHERNKSVRGLLAEAVQALPADAPEPRATIAAHLRERIARDPYSTRSRQP